MRSIGPAVTREQSPAFLRNSNGRLDFPGQHKRHPELTVVTRESRRNTRKTRWFPSHRKMKPFPATASQEKRSEEHTSELQSPLNLVCRLLLEKKKKNKNHKQKKNKKKKNNKTNKHKNKN